MRPLAHPADVVVTHQRRVWPGSDYSDIPYDMSGAAMPLPPVPDIDSASAFPAPPSPGAASGAPHYYSFWCVFDGHNGAAAATMSGEHVTEILEELLPYGPPEPPDSPYYEEWCGEVQRAVAETIPALNLLFAGRGIVAGCTATLVLQVCRAALVLSGVSLPFVPWLRKACAEAFVCVGWVLAWELWHWGGRLGGGGWQELLLAREAGGRQECTWLRWTQGACPAGGAGVMLCRRDRYIAAPAVCILFGLCLLACTSNCSPAQIHTHSRPPRPLPALPAIPHSPSPSRCPARWAGW